MITHFTVGIQSMKSIIDDNRYQSTSVNCLILIIDDQSMAKIHVVIDWYRLINKFIIGFPISDFH